MEETTSLKKWSAGSREEGVPKQGMQCSFGLAASSCRICNTKSIFHTEPLEPLVLLLGTIKY